MYNFEIKTKNIITKLKMRDIQKSTQLDIYWSPYFDSPKVKNKTKIGIQKRYTDELINKYKLNVYARWLNAPHQMERVIPLTLANDIITKL